MDDLSTDMFLWLIPLNHHPGPVNKTENSAKTIKNAPSLLSLCPPLSLSLLTGHLKYESFKKSEDIIDGVCQQQNGNKKRLGENLKRHELASPHLRYTITETRHQPGKTRVNMYWKCFLPGKWSTPSCKLLKMTRLLFKVRNGMSTKS